MSKATKETVYRNQKIAAPFLARTNARHARNRANKLCRTRIVVEILLPDRPVPKIRKPIACTRIKVMNVADMRVRLWNGRSRRVIVSDEHS